MAEQPIPIACDMTALSVEQRNRHTELWNSLEELLTEVKELPNGFAFGYEASEKIWMAAAEFVELERLCCPFFTFTLVREPEGGSIWLNLTGGQAVKDFLATQLNHRVSSQ